MDRILCKLQKVDIKKIKFYRFRRFEKLKISWLLNFLKMYIFQSAEKTLFATSSKTFLTLIRHRFMIKKTKNNPIFNTKKK